MPSRRTGLRRDAIVIALGFGLSVAVSVYLGGPGSDLPLGHTILLGTAWLLVSVAATWEGVARGRSMLGRPTLVRALVAGATPLALLVTALLVALAWPETLAIPAGMGEHTICVVFTLLFALGPLVAFAVVRRRSDPIAPRLTGASLGAASGAWGALAVELHCGHASAMHILLGHVAPVVLLTVLGAVVGDQVVAVRSRP